jgi:hypothetical protein
VRTNIHVAESSSAAPPLPRVPLGTRILISMQVNMATSANAPGLMGSGMAPLPPLPPMPAAPPGGSSAASLLSAAMQSSAPRLDNIAALAASAVFGGVSAPVPQHPEAHSSYSAAPPLPPTAPLPGAAAGGAPSRVVAINNMATAADLADPELEGDILGEASKCGTVTALKFIRHPTDGNRVTVFIAFSTPDQAAIASARLDKRYFGGQVTATSLFPQARFDAGDYYVP